MPDEGGQRLSHHTASGIAEKVEGAFKGYSHGSDRPLAGYAAILGAYAAAAGVGVAVTRRSHRSIPRTLSTRDIALVALATYQLSRMMTKDAVTSAIRAPFTEYEGPAGPAELQEGVRGGSGLRHAIGELLTCPFCMSHWIATGFGFGFVVAPDATRLMAAMLSAETASDFLQFARAAAQRRIQ